MAQLLGIGLSGVAAVVYDFRTNKERIVAELLGNGLSGMSGVAAVVNLSLEPPALLNLSPAYSYNVKKISIWS